MGWRMSERLREILRRAAHEALALIFGFGLMAFVVLTVWTFQGKI